jgi:8-hydroxy-5-deazaflavin:NADPH oxidoreductase
MSSTEHIGIIGSGAVGKALATGFAAHGHRVTLGTRTPSKLADFSVSGVTIGDFAQAAGGNVVVVAVAGAVAADAIRLAGPEKLDGKVVIDTCNPIGGAPKNGVLPYFTTGDSLMQRLQAEFPAARFVKAFNSVGSAIMIDPKLPGGRGTMFICGNDATAKGLVTALLDEVGWDAEDVGGVEGAGPVEALCQLWCAPGFLRNQWGHAFKLVKL